MKIGFVLDDSLDSTDGVQQYILTLGAWLKKQGHDVHYLVGETTRSDIENVHSLSRNKTVRFNGNRMSIPLPANKGKIKQLLKDEQFDVLHVQMPYSPFMAAKVIKQAPKGTKVIGTFHILPYGKLQNRGAKLLSWRLRRTTKKIKPVISVSQPAQKFAKDLKVPSIVIPNVIDTSRFAKGHRVQRYQKTFTIVFLGRLVERKGCLELLQATQVLKHQGKVSNFKVIIGGTGPQLHRLRQWVKRRNLDDVVEFIGFVPERGKANLLASADIAVFPSLGGESFGIVLVEAMAANAGVVLGGSNAGYRSVLGSIPQSLFNPENTIEFAQKLTVLCRDARMRALLHKQQQKLVKQYDVAVVGQKLLSYYKQEA